MFHYTFGCVGGNYPRNSLGCGYASRRVGAPLPKLHIPIQPALLAAGPVIWARRMTYRAPQKRVRKTCSNCVIFEKSLPWRCSSASANPALSQARKSRRGGNAPSRSRISSSRRASARRACSGSRPGAGSAGSTGCRPRSRRSWSRRGRGRHAPWNRPLPRRWGSH